MNPGHFLGQVRPVYALVFTDAYEGESLIQALYDNQEAAETARDAMKEKYPWMAYRYQVEEREVES